MFPSPRRNRSPPHTPTAFLPLALPSFISPSAPPTPAPYPSPTPSNHPHVLPSSRSAALAWTLPLSLATLSSPHLSSRASSVSHPKTFMLAAPQQTNRLSSRICNDPSPKAARVSLSPWSAT